MDNKERNMVTKQEIIHALATNDRALYKALVLLNQRQTADERASETTRYTNGRGFNAAHAKRGTSMANFYLRAGFLTPKQKAWWRAPEAKGGAMRIAIYAGQLMEEAAAKQARIAAQQQM
jgi:hypothetical protein